MNTYKFSHNYKNYGDGIDGDGGGGNGGEVGGGDDGGGSADTVMIPSQTSDGSQLMPQHFLISFV